MTAQAPRRRCYYCREKPARSFPSMPGAFGRVAVFCSIRCAYRHATTPVLCGALLVCPKCGKWYHDTDGCCPEDTDE